MSDRTYSLVVMTRDRPDPLACCLASIERLRWHGASPEIVIVDDGSDPPARAVAERFSSLRIVSVRQETRGVASARNRGIEAANGTHIGFLADDYELPAGYLEDVDAFFEEHPEGEMISHNIEPSGPSLLRPVQRLYLDLALGQRFVSDEPLGEIVQSFALPASRAAVFRRTIFHRLGNFDERLTVGEDGEFGRRMAQAGIPVCMFLHKRVVHHDARTALDYFRQRVRYGRSVVRTGVGDLMLPESARRTRAGTIVGLLGLLAAKLAQWWEVAGRLGIRRRFLALSPMLVLFLCFFYGGAYRELRDTTRREES